MRAVPDRAAGINRGCPLQKVDDIVWSGVQPEFLSDVQKCSKAVYMRTTEAAQCNVRSVLLLPLFGDPQRRTTIGVVEVAQSTDKMPFDNVVTALSVALKASSLSLLGSNHSLNRDQDGATSA